MRTHAYTGSHTLTRTLRAFAHTQFTTMHANIITHTNTHSPHTHTHTVGKIVGLVGASMDAGKDGKDADPLSDLVTALRHIGGTTTGANALLAQACR